MSFEALVSPFSPCASLPLLLILISSQFFHDLSALHYIKSLKVIAIKIYSFVSDDPADIKDPGHTDDLLSSSEMCHRSHT